MGGGGGTGGGGAKLAELDNDRDRKRVVLDEDRPTKMKSMAAEQAKLNPKKVPHSQKRKLVTVTVCYGSSN